MAVYIGLVFYSGLLFAQMIYGRMTSPGAPVFIPLIECDFETGSFRGPGGGELMRAQNAAEKASAGKSAVRWRWVRTMEAFGF